MKQCIVIFATTFLLSLNSFGQTENLEDLNNKLFLNAYVYEKADSLTLIFLKSNFSYLTKVRPTGGWVRPPIGVDAKQTITSFKFKKHPFFNFPIKDGQLDFATIEIPGEPKFETGAELWLFFDNENDANKAFGELVELYKNVSTTKDINEANGQKTAKFTGAGSKNSIRKANLSLSKIDDTNFEINFKNWFRSN